MEPNFLQTALINFALIYGGPFIAFAFGVFIADRLALHDIRKRSNLYLIAIPVALLTIGLMVSSTKIEQATEDQIVYQYGHLSAMDQYLIFNAIIIFYGTLVPQTFHKVRGQIAMTPLAGGDPSPPGS